MSLLIVRRLPLPHLPLPPPFCLRGRPPSLPHSCIFLRKPSCPHFSRRTATLRLANSRAALLALLMTNIINLPVGYGKTQGHISREGLLLVRRSVK